MDFQNTKRISAEQALPTMLDAAENALSHNIFGELEHAHTGLKKASYYFIVIVLTDIARKGSLEDLIERNPERWTH